MHGGQPRNAETTLKGGILVLEGEMLCKGNPTLPVIAGNQPVSTIVFWVGYLL